MFGGIDFIIIVLVLSGILVGILRGILGVIIDLIGILIGSIIASFVYQAPVNLFKKFNITGSVVELIWYLLCFFVFTLIVILLLELGRKRIETRSFVDKFFGAILGIGEGFVYATGILIIMSGSFNAANEIQQSRTAEYVLRYLPKIYEKVERTGITLPKMMFLPEKYSDEFNPKYKKIRFVKINFVKLDGATCIKCGEKVKFAGYFLKYGASVVPKFVCTKCGRTSCGCQTYEGFHLLYGKCPVELAEEGEKIDCGQWPNDSPVIPKGPCPVCGKTLKVWKLEF
ncbi:MAG: hypothetical protein DRP67_06255 [Candidatus Omnitrophota bacterium]|nr:MAG: hypothetical protein DRP67_06255 [Candidatus Omnitrophota bacterium]